MMATFLLQNHFAVATIERTDNKKFGSLFHRYRWSLVTWPTTAINQRRRVCGNLLFRPRRHPRQLLPMANTICHRVHKTPRTHVKTIITRHSGPNVPHSHFPFNSANSNSGIVNSNGESVSNQHQQSEHVACASNWVSEALVHNHQTGHYPLFCHMQKVAKSVFDPNKAVQIS